MSKAEVLASWRVRQIEKKGLDPLREAFEAGWRLRDDRWHVLIGKKELPEVLEKDWQIYAKRKGA